MDGNRCTSLSWAPRPGCILAGPDLVRIAGRPGTEDLIASVADADAFLRAARALGVPGPGR